MLLFRAMSNPLLNSTPQFGTAEYGSSGDRCKLCQQPIGPVYYRIKDAIVCSSCADRARTESARDSHAAYVRALAAGIGAAVAGLIAYALISILLQGWVISYMSFGVGWLVGTAMMKASGGFGGRRYQIAAVLLTYAAVSMAAVPIWIYFSREDHAKHTQQQKQQQAEEQQSDDESSQQGTSSPRRPTLSVGGWLARVAMLGLASPFLELQNNPLWGAIGLFILFIGIKIAWRITAGIPMDILGPFHNSPQPML
jgi:hypothetical protein